MATSGHGKPFAARRRWLIAGAVSVVSTVVDASGANGKSAIEVWIDLSEPVSATAVGATDAQQRQRQVASQQDIVGDRLRELGIAELARVRHARNAILVRATPVQLDLLRGIPGVVRVRPVDTLHPPKPMP
jgi:hypothetical protein